MQYGDSFVSQPLPADPMDLFSPVGDLLDKKAPAQAAGDDAAAREEKMHGKTLVTGPLDHKSLPSGLFAAVSHHGDVALFRLLPLLPRLDPAATDDDKAQPVTQQLWLHHIDDVPVLSISIVAVHGPERPPVIVVCCWNGVTHLFDVEGHHAKFSFVHNVQSFAAGCFALEPGRQSMCFAYATFHHMIVLYHHVECMCLPSRTLIDILCADPEVTALLSELVAESSVDRPAEAYGIIRTILQQQLLNPKDCAQYADDLQDRLTALQQKRKAEQEEEERQQQAAAAAVEVPSSETERTAPVSAAAAEPEATEAGTEDITSKTPDTEVIE